MRARRFVAAAGVLAALAPAVAAAPADAAPACKKLKEGQRLHVSIRYRYIHTRSMVSNGVLHETRYKDVTDRFARMTIEGATCKEPRSGWRVIDPIGVGFRSGGLSSDGDIRGDGLKKGWGIGIRGGEGGSSPRIHLQVMHCGEDVFWSFVKKLNSIPIPGLAFVVGVAKWAGGHLLPDDKIECADLGGKTLQVVAGPRGGLRVHEHDNAQSETWIATSTDGWTTRKMYDVLPIVVRRR